MTTAQDCFIDALAAKAVADPRIRAAWLAGSFGKETADRWSDVDAHLLLDADAIHEFRGEVENWLGQIRPLVFVRTMFDGQMINAMTDEAMRLDVWLHSGEHAEVTTWRDTSAIRRRECAGMAALSRRRPHAGSGRGASEQGSSRILALRRHVAGGRGPRGKAGRGGWQLNNPSLLTDVLCAASGRRRDRGVKALNSYLLLRPPRARGGGCGTDQFCHLKRRRASRCVWPASCASAVQPFASGGRWLIRRQWKTLFCAT